MTTNGKLIWDILKQAQADQQHLTAEEIYLLAKRKAPGIAMATVYNNLNSLVEEGVIRRLQRYDGPYYYDANILPHDHMICDCCHKISDIILEDFPKQLQAGLRMKITGYDLVIHYVCEECRKKENGGNENGKQI